MSISVVINSFTANPTSVVAGSFTVLTWSTSSAIECDIDGVSVPTSGSKTVYPTKSGYFTLHAGGSESAATRQVYVNVIGTTVPPIIPPVTPPPTTPTYYTLTIKTVPGSSTVVISGVGTFTTLSSASVGIGNIPAGSHTITISLAGYQDYSETINFTANITRTITLTASPTICTPGATKCIGVDLYVCNTSGTAWTLKQANSPTCKASAAVPDFWSDPVGWVVAVITTAFETMLGFVSGQFKVFLQSLKSFQDTYMALLVAFIRDPLRYLRGLLDVIYVSLSVLAGEVLKIIGIWWNTALLTVQAMIGVAVQAANAFISSFWTILGIWWNTALAVVNGIINIAIQAAVSAINTALLLIQSIIQTVLSTISGIIDGVPRIAQGLIDAAVGAIKTWVEGFVSTFSEALASEFFTGLDRGIHTTHHSPFDAEQLTDNGILIGLQRYMKKYREGRENEKVK